MSINSSELDRRLDGLDREAPPPEHVWEALQARLHAGRQNRWRSRWLAAVAAIALAALILVPIWQTLAPQSSGQPADDKIAAERALLTRPVPADAWPPQAPRAEGLNQAWEENEQAISALETALEASPDNLLLLEFLAEARMRQAELIQLAARFEPLSSPTENRP